MNKRTKFLAVVCALAGIFSYLLESEAISLTLEGESLFWGAAAAGATLGVLILLFFKNHVAKINRERGVFCVVIIGGLALLSTASACYINIKFSSRAEKHNTFLITGKTYGTSKSGKPNRFFLSILTEYGNDKISVPEDFWNKAKIPDSIYATTIPGLFNAPYIIEYKLNTTQ